MDEQSTFSTPTSVTFHKCHGRNIELSENNTVAFRKFSYDLGITFSREPLQPGEIFLFEIEEVERDWIGNLYLGLMQENPSSFEPFHPALRSAAIVGKSWILPVNTIELNLLGNTCISNLYPTIYESNNYVHAGKGSFPVSILLPSRHKSTNLGNSGGEKYISSISSPFSKASLDESKDAKEHVYPDVGSRIGVTYVIRDNLAEMYFLFNGSVFGPCATDIPYRKGPIYASVDLYGSTKKVRIIQTIGIQSLKNACRDKILQQVSPSKVFQLPLPKILINFLNFKC